MSESGVEFPLDFSAITEELKRQSKELGAADKQLDAFQAKSAEFARKRDGVAKQMQRQRERAFMSAVRGAGASVAARPGEEAAVWAAKAREMESFIASKKEAGEAAFWDDKVGAARDSAFQDRKNAAAIGSPRATSGDGGIAAALRPAITGSQALGAAATAAGFAVRTFGQILASEAAAKKEVFDKETGKRLSLSQSAAYLGMNPQAMLGMANASGDTEGFQQFASKVAMAHFRRQTYMGGGRFQMAADAGKASGDYGLAAELAIQGDFPAINRLGGVDLGYEGRGAQDKRRQRDSYRNQWQARAYDNGDTFRLAMSEEEKARLSVENPVGKWIGDQFGGLGTEIRARRLADYNMSNGAYTNTLSGIGPVTPTGPTSPTPQLSSGLPIGARYPDMGQAAQALTNAAQTMHDASTRRAPRIDTTGAPGWGMQ